MDGNGVIRIGGFKKGYYMTDSLSYSKSGVDIDITDAVKRDMTEIIDFGDERVLNRMGAFGTLVDGRFENYRHPILVLKTEEPGSKQKLAFQHGRVSSNKNLNW